jgi:hypothetical protein
VTRAGSWRSCRNALVRNVGLAESIACTRCKVEERRWNLPIANVRLVLASALGRLMRGGYKPFPESVL